MRDREPIDPAQTTSGRAWDRSRSARRPPVGASVNLELTPGEPYYPRDDVEAGKLAEQLEWQEAFEASPKEVGRPGWLDHGRLRRITPREAYRIRKRKEHTDGMGS